MAIRIKKAAAAKKAPAAKPAAKAAKTKPSAAKPAAKKPAAKKTPRRAAKPASLDAAALTEGKAHAVRPAAPERPTGGVISVPLSRLRENPANYRRSYDLAAIDELAASILAEGVLQNLVVLPADADGIYIVNSGNRRLRALMGLRDAGEIGPDHPVPVLPRAMSEAEALALAIVENLQRQDVDPLDEADGFRRLRDLGWTTAAIADSVGVKQRTVQDRLQLSEGLFPAAREALAARKISLDQARALVTAPMEDLQTELLALATRKVMPLDSTALRQHLKRTLPAVSAAAFPLERYTGAYIGEGEERRFADAAQFEALQKARAEEIAGELRAKWAHVEITGCFYPWNYRQDDNPATGGAVVEYNPAAGRITVHEGYAPRHEGEEEDAPDSQDRLFLEKKTGALNAFAGDLRAAMERQPSLAPRIVILSQLVMGGTRLAGLASEEISPRFAAILRETLDEPGLSHEEAVEDADALRIWTKLLELSDRAIGELFAALTIDELLALNAGPDAPEWRVRSILFSRTDIAIAASAGIEIPEILRAAAPAAEGDLEEGDLEEDDLEEDETSDGDGEFSSEEDAA